MGFAGYYHRFVYKFSELARPVHCLTKKNQPFKWSEECQAAFQHLKKGLLSPSILTYPQFDRMFILDTDASNEGLGAVLSQVGEDGHERVIAYGSRLLTKAERRYCVTRKELLAVVTFTRKFRPYLLGKKFLLCTDHGTLVCLTNFKDSQGQLAQWLEILQEFSFEVQHRSGSKHTNADALSRLPCPQCGRSQLTEEAPPVGITSLVPQHSGEMREAQLNDLVIGPILCAKESGIKPLLQQQNQGTIAARRLLQLWDQLIICNGVLYKQ